MIKERSSPAGQPSPVPWAAIRSSRRTGSGSGSRAERRAQDRARTGAPPSPCRSPRPAVYSPWSSGPGSTTDPSCSPRVTTARLFRVNGDGSGQHLVLDRGRLGAGLHQPSSPRCRMPGRAGDDVRHAACVTGGSGCWICPVARSCQAGRRRLGSLVHVHRAAALRPSRRQRSHSRWTPAPRPSRGGRSRCSGRCDLVRCPGRRLRVRRLPGLRRGGTGPVAGAAGQIVAVDRGGRATTPSIASAWPVWGFESPGVTGRPAAGAGRGCRRGSADLRQELPDGPRHRLTCGGGGGRVGWTPGGQDVLFVGQRDGAFVALRRRADGTAAESVVATDRRSV